MLQNLHLSPKIAEKIAELTVNESSSSLWQEHRKGRLTASVIHKYVATVNGDSLSAKSTRAPIATVMDYYEKCTVPSLEWGKVN